MSLQEVYIYCVVGDAEFDLKYFFQLSVLRHISFINSKLSIEWYLETICLTSY